MVGVRVSLGSQVGLSDGVLVAHPVWVGVAVGAYPSGVGVGGYQNAPGSTMDSVSSSDVSGSLSLSL